MGVGGGASPYVLSCPVSALTPGGGPLHWKWVWSVGGSLQYCWLEGTTCEDERACPQCWEEGVRREGEVSPLLAHWKGWLVQGGAPNSLLPWEAPQMTLSLVHSQRGWGLVVVETALR